MLLLWKNCSLFATIQAALLCSVVSSDCYIHVEAVCFLFLFGTELVLLVWLRKHLQTVPSRYLLIMLQGLVSGLPSQQMIKASLSQALRGLSSEPFIIRCSWSRSVILWDRDCVPLNSMRHHPETGPCAEAAFAELVLSIFMEEWSVLPPVFLFITLIRSASLISRCKNLFRSHHFMIPPTCTLLHLQPPILLLLLWEFTVVLSPSCQVIHWCFSLPHWIFKLTRWGPLLTCQWQHWKGDSCSYVHIAERGKAGS